MNVWVTERWCGFGEIKSKLIKEKFDEELDRYFAIYFVKIYNIFKQYDANNKGLCDLMVFLLNDDGFINISGCFKLLVTGYVLVTIYGHIDFSCAQYKYFFWKK